MQIQLLGYSEATISRILDALLLYDYQDEVVIVQNIKLNQSILFCPDGIKYKIIDWTDWKFNSQLHHCLPAVMNPGVKKTICNFFNKNCGVLQENYTTILHPSSIISSTVKIGKGSFIEPAAVLASFATLGFGVYINRAATIGHHTILGDFVNINPGVHIAGHCNIGEGTQIGIGSVIFDHITIGRNSVIGGGSVVTKDIPDNVIAWGNPCKVIKHNSAS